MQISSSVTVAFASTSHLSRHQHLHSANTHLRKRITFVYCNIFVQKLPNCAGVHPTQSFNALFSSASKLPLQQLLVIPPQQAASFHRRGISVVNKSLRLVLLSRLGGNGVGVAGVVPVLLGWRNGCLSIYVREMRYGNAVVVEVVERQYSIRSMQSRSFRISGVLVKTPMSYVQLARAFWAELTP